MDQEGQGVTPAPPIVPHERVARFEYDKGKYVRQDGNPKGRAFAPAFDEERQRFETSLFRISSLDGDAIWACGDRAGEKRGKKATGYCSLPAGKVVETNLRLENDVPPELHTVVVGWPDGDDKQMELANMLAEAAAGGGRRR